MKVLEQIWTCGMFLHSHEFSYICSALPLSHLLYSVGHKCMQFLQSFTLDWVRDGVAMQFKNDQWFCKLYF